jgi:hypothetical protein
MLGRIHEKMATPKLALRGGTFSAFDSTTARNNASVCNDPCAPGGDCSIVARNGFWNNTHTSNFSSKGMRLGRKPSTLVQRAQCTSGSSGAWGPTPFKFCPHNVECKNGEG